MKTSARVRYRLRVEPLETRALMANAGSLDPTFGGGQGFLTFSPGSKIGQFSSDAVVADGVAIQPDGKVLIGGTTTSGEITSFVIERLNANGTIDTSYGQNGLFSEPVPGPSAAQRFGSAVGVYLQSDGKILVVGSANQFSANASSHTYFAIRTNADGTIDTTYGTNGVATGAFDTTGLGVGLLQQVTSASLQPDGKLVLAGSAAEATSGQTDFAAVRLNTDGSVDTTFGKSGTALVPVTISGKTTGDATGLAIQSNGQILLAGTVVIQSSVVAPPDITQTFYDSAVIRLNADGTQDTTYGGPTTGGVIVLPPDPANPSSLGSNLVKQVTLQPDGKLLLEGTNNLATSGFNNAAMPALTRLDADGTIDTSFGQNGRETPSFSGPTAIEPDGKILVAGTVTLTQSTVGGTFGRSAFAVLRLEADGTADSTFGNTATTGLAQFSFGPSNITPAASALAVQTDGNVVLAGSSSVYGGNFSTDDNFAVARVLTQVTTGAGPTPLPPTPPASFDGSGVTDLAVYLPAAGAFAYRPVGIYGDQIVPFGISGAGQTLSAAADYEGTGQTQIAAYLPQYGVYAIRPTGGGADQLFGFGIAGAGQSIPVPADYDGDGKADVAVYLTTYGAFGIRPSSGGADEIIPFGIAGAGNSIPAPGDYTGDGKADLAVYLPAFGAFAIRPSGGGADEIIPFGLSGAGQSIPIPGDYDGSGKTELAVYLPSLGIFAYRPANGGPDVLTSFGAVGDGTIPVPGDYDGSGKTEIAVYDPKYGTFAYRPANGGPDVIVAFGSAGIGQSVPVASLIVPMASTAKAASFTQASTSPVASVSSPSVSASKSAAIPGGPMVSVATRKVAKTAILQAKPEPLLG